MKKTLVFLIACTIAFIAGNAQPNKYLFRQGAATYTELTQATVASPIIFASGDNYTVPLTGDNFSFFNKNYTINGTTVLIEFSTNGHVQVGDDTSLIVVDGVFSYLDSIDLSSSVSYKIEGAGNNKILKVQWKNLKVRNGASGNYVNFQIWVHQATGIFETHYGPSSASNLAGYTSSNGPFTGLFYSNLAVTQMHEKLWLYQLPSNVRIDSARSITFPAMHGVPQDGTVYRFIPKTVAASVPTGNKEDGITIYPNPARGKIYFKTPTVLAEEVQVVITDLSGKTVHTSHLPKGTSKGTVNTTGIAAGNYFLRLESKEINQVISIILE